MTEDRLAHLLRGADAAAPLPPAAGDLAVRVRRAAHAQLRRRQSAAAVVLVLVSTAAALWMGRAPTPDVGKSIASATATAPSVSNAEVEAVKAQADLLLSVADRLLSRQARRPLPPPAGGPTIESERDKAALAMFDHAERLRRDLKEVDAALAAYRRTVELFPGTRWAAVAKQRIEQLEPEARRIEPEHLLT